MGLPLGIYTPPSTFQAVTTLEICVIHSLAFLHSFGTHLYMSKPEAGKLFPLRAQELIF